MNEICKRVSIRKYESREVEKEKIEKIHRAAMAAPSAGNLQPWEFYAVTDKEKIKALSECSQYSGCAAGAPVVIVPCQRTEGLWAPEIAQIDMSITTENILLEIVSQGLGGVWLAVAPLPDRIEKGGKSAWTGRGAYAFCHGPAGISGREQGTAGSL